MRILITGKNIEVSDYLRELVNKKVSKLERYFPNDTVAQVTMAVERSRHIVEVTIPYSGGIIRGATHYFGTRTADRASVSAGIHAGRAEALRSTVRNVPHVLRYAFGTRTAH